MIGSDFLLNSSQFRAILVNSVNSCYLSLFPVIKCFSCHFSSNSSKFYQFQQILAILAQKVQNWDFSLTVAQNLDLHCKNIHISSSLGPMISKDIYLHEIIKVTHVIHASGKETSEEKKLVIFLVSFPHLIPHDRPFQTTFHIYMIKHNVPVQRESEREGRGQGRLLVYIWSC